MKKYFFHLKEVVYIYIYFLDHISEKSSYTNKKRNESKETTPFCSSCLKVQFMFKRIFTLKKNIEINSVTIFRIPLIKSIKYWQ